MGPVSRYSPTVIKTPSTQTTHSYVVKTESGRVYHRNRRNLRSNGIQNTGQDNILDSFELSDISQKPNGPRYTPSQHRQSISSITPVNTSPPRPNMGASSTTPKHYPKANTPDAVSSPIKAF